MSIKHRHELIIRASNTTHQEKPFSINKKMKSRRSNE
jgi:hypothetical protein